jgi:hypothetical protein
MASTIKAEMDALWHNHTWDVVDRPVDRKIVDSKWVFKINALLMDLSTNSKHD